MVKVVSNPEMGGMWFANVITITSVDLGKCRLGPATVAFPIDKPNIPTHWITASTPWFEVRFPRETLDRKSRIYASVSLSTFFAFNCGIEGVLRISFSVW